MVEVNLGAEIEANLPAYRRYALRLTGNVSDAEDLFQRTYERALSRRDQIRDNPVQWMYSVMRSQYLNDRRRSSREEHGIVFDELSGEHDVRRHKLRSVDDDISILPDESSRLRLILEQELAQLSPAKAQAIQKKADDLTYAEIAQQEQTNVGTIRSRLHAARQALRERLLQYQLIRDLVT